MNKGPVSCSRTLYCFCTELRKLIFSVRSAPLLSIMFRCLHYINLFRSDKVRPTQNPPTSFATRTKVKNIHHASIYIILLATIFRYFAPFFLILSIFRPLLPLLCSHFSPFCFPFYQMQPVFRALMETIPAFPVIFIKNTKNQPLFVHRIHMPTEHIDGIKKELHTL